MRSGLKSAFGVGVVVALGGLMLVVAGIVSCGGAPTPFVVHGPGSIGNDRPTLAILEPFTNITRGQGDPFLIRWADTDRDNNALIMFELISATSNDRVLLVSNIAENDLVGPDAFTVGTTLIPPGTYNVLGTIDDGVNDPVEEFAMVAQSAVSQRVVVRIVGPGEGPQTQPPVVVVVEPMFNLSVSQDDTLTVAVQPSLLAPDPDNPRSFDPDSTITLFIVLDLDQDPNNDDPANPDPSQIILLRSRSIEPGAFETITFQESIDLSIIPPRPDGAPYFIRATVDDGTNRRVHSYAVGTISVVQLAGGLVDLFDIGRTKSGARFYGFNPAANLGSSISHVGDFDADGVDDFVLVAQFGNPRNFGPIGEAYLIYGQGRLQEDTLIVGEGSRFGGAIGVNSIMETVPGVLFEAPPVRLGFFNAAARTDGITDVGFVRDLSGDGRPELLFGLQHVHGAFEAMDFDPGDDDIRGSDNTIDIEIVLQQGRVTVQTGQEDPVLTSLTYAGIEETTISSASPNTSFGSDAAVSWQDNGPGQREWGLIRLRNVLNEVPDSPANIDFTTIQASLELRVFNTGGQGDVREVLTPFNEQVRFNNFAQNGGEPEAGVDYVDEDAGVGLESISGDTPEIVSLDVSELVRQLLDGELTGSDNELRFIILPTGDEASDPTAIRSSEYNIQADRPALRINYTRLNFLGALNCYPDPYVNNLADPDDEPLDDTYFYSGGMVVTVNSQNRDSADVTGINPTRLENTVVTLELAGQEAGFVLDADGLNAEGGGIFARASNAAAEPLDGEDAQTGRISGSRVVAGAFDFIDARLLNQPPREGLFGQTVGSIGDLNNDGLDEIIISAPRNERYVQSLIASFGFQSTHFWSTMFQGSIIVLPGFNYNDNVWREKNDNSDGSAVIPTLDQFRLQPVGRCSLPTEPRHFLIPADSFEVFAEDLDDMLGGASSAGDFNQDGLDDILCGAPLNDRNSSLPDSGAIYVLYGRNVIGNFNLKNADDPVLRAPMLRVRGVNPNDQIGWAQTRGLDVNGDRIDDVFFSSPRADYGGVTRSTCAADFNRDGVVNSADLGILTFNDCEQNFGEEVFSSDACKAFDYDNDGKIDGEDRCVFCCLSSACEPAEDCIISDSGSCCDNLVDNGFAGIIFGGVFIDGDRDIGQLATSQLPGAIFFGSAAGHRAGMDISSAGDFNQDGFGDVLISVPGETRLDSAGRSRLGVVYLIFGGTHLVNTTWNLRDVDTEQLPGIVFISPYVKGRPNEAAPTTVAFIGDINNDGFGDIAIGNPKADFIDLSFPQGPDAPGSDPATGRRSNAGDVYIIYGNNFGSNRAVP